MSEAVLLCGSDPATVSDHPSKLDPSILRNSKQDLDVYSWDRFFEKRGKMMGRASCKNVGKAGDRLSRSDDGAYVCF